MGLIEGNWNDFIPHNKFLFRGLQLCVPNIFSKKHIILIVTLGRALWAKKDFGFNRHILLLAQIDQ